MKFLAMHINNQKLSFDIFTVGKADLFFQKYNNTFDYLRFSDIGLYLFDKAGKYINNVYFFNVLLPFFYYLIPFLISGLFWLVCKIYLNYTFLWYIFSKHFIVIFYFWNIYLFKCYIFMI